MTLVASAFMSYVRFDDEHENGRLTELCTRLSHEVRIQLGDAFPIFQDRNGIAWGQQWQQRIEDSVDAASFLIPIVTPAYFKSAPCRAEFERFLHREKALRRTDLILPVYYVNCPVLVDHAAIKRDVMAAVIAGRQFADWRDLRFEAFSSSAVGKMLAKMATQIIEALERSGTGRALTAGPTEQAEAPPSPIAAAPPRGLVARPPVFANGPSYKTAPPTHIVDSSSRGDFATLTEAVDAAAAGDRILVRPGLYQEGVLIQKPLEIIGDGDREDIVIEAAGKPVILFCASMGRVSNLTLRLLTGAPAIAVDIAQGHLELENCDVTSQSLACIAIHDGADPRVRRNRIHHGLDQGVLVSNDGLGTIEDNDIFENSSSGIEIRTGSRPAVRNNRIHDGKKGGVFILDNGEGTLEDNELFANAFAAVEISSGARPTLRRNRIHDGTAGVFVNSNGSGTLEENEISGSQMAGVTITSGGNPVLVRNRIHHGRQSGVLVADRGRGSLTENQILDNEGVGVTVKTEGDPVLRRNRISGNKYEAVWVYEFGKGTFEDNDLSGNARGAWDISEDSANTVVRQRNRE